MHHLGSWGINCFMLEPFLFWQKVPNSDGFGLVFADSGRIFFRNWGRVAEWSLYALLCNGTEIEGLFIGGPR